MARKNQWGLLLALLGFLVAALAVLSSASAQAQLQITSPAEGTEVNPGQTITITISADASIQNIGVITETPLPDVQATSSPTQFSLTIPATIAPGSYHLTAVGTSSGNDVESDPIAIAIERPDQPVRVRIEPSIIRFRTKGQKVPLRVIGFFADGSQADLTGSTNTTFNSTNTQVASVSDTGMVMATGAGSAVITVDSGSVTFSIQVRVPQPSPPTFILQISKQGPGSGTVTSNDGSINCGSTCSASFDSGTVVMLTATPAPGSVFGGWGGACSGTQACMVIMNAAQTVSATFTQQPPIVTLQVSKQGTGSGTVTSNDGSINCGSTCSASYGTGTMVTLTATAAAGSVFGGWGGACSGIQACMVTMNAAQMISATFKQILPGALSFVPVTPCRVADTRLANGPFGGPFLAGQAFRGFTIPNSACNIPATAQAYSLNVTVVPHGGLGFLTTFPCGQAQPLVSTLNSADGRVKAVAALTPAGTNGAVCFFVTNDTELVLDINGYFVPATNPAGLAFYPVSPCRMVDTRLAAGPLGGPSLVGGVARVFPLLTSPCNVPGTAQAYSLNFTSVPKGPLGFLTTWPTGQAQPLVSTLNAPTGAVTANAAIVPAGNGGAVSLFATNDSDLIIDVNGYFAPPGAGGLAMFNLSPCRVLDTRNPAGSPPLNGAMNVNVAANRWGAPATAQSYVLNATVVPSGPLGFLTLWPQGRMQPLVSTLNASDGAVTSNLGLVPTTNGSVSAFTSNPSHLVLDISGYFGSASNAPIPLETLNTGSVTQDNASIVEPIPILTPPQSAIRGTGVLGTPDATGVGSGETGRHPQHPGNSISTLRTSGIKGMITAKSCVGMQSSFPCGPGPFTINIMNTSGTEKQVLVVPDRLGRFQLELLPGRYIIGAETNEQGLDSSVVEVEVKSGQFTDVQVPFRTINP